MSRRCGDCTVCCTLMGVPDLEPDGKLPGDRCSHACSRGCRIYAARPTSCRQFECLWLQGGLPKPFRPDRVGIVFSVTPDGEKIVGFYDEARPTAWHAMRAHLTAMGLAGAVTLVGPAGGKPLFMFGPDGEKARPPEADEGMFYGAEQDEAAGDWVVFSEQAGVRVVVERCSTMRWALAVLEKLEAVNAG
jgi:hypothetical protein